MVELSQTNQNPQNKSHIRPMWLSREWLEARFVILTALAIVFSLVGEQLFYRNYPSSQNEFIPIVSWDKIEPACTKNIEAKKSDPSDQTPLLNILFTQRERRGSLPIGYTVLIVPPREKEWRGSHFRVNRQH